MIRNQQVSGSSPLAGSNRINNFNHQAAGRHRHTTGPSRRGRLNSSYAGSAVAPRLVQVNCALAAGRQEAGYPRAVHAPVVRRPTRAPRLRPVTAPPRRSTAPPRATRRPAWCRFPYCCSRLGHRLARGGGVDAEFADRRAVLRHREFLFRGSDAPRVACRRTSSTAASRSA